MKQVWKNSPSSPPSRERTFDPTWLILRTSSNPSCTGMAGVRPINSNIMQIHMGFSGSQLCRPCNQVPKAMTQIGSQMQIAQHVTKLSVKLGAEWAHPLTIKALRRLRSGNSTALQIYIH